MILGIAACDRDLQQAIRLMRWIGFLSSKHENSMLNESCLIVLSRRAALRQSHRELCWLASQIFGEARCYIPDTEQERGWPGSANFMFAQCLTHVEKHFGDDVFFLEPDGVPVKPEWYDLWLAEWEVARENGKSFMGASVPHSTPHMTGIAVYGREWRSTAPMLIGSPDHDAFDTYSAPQVMPRAHFTHLIQHVFRRSDPGWTVPHLGILDKRAALFHQDKKGFLIRMLDDAHFNGECANHPLFGYRTNYEPEKAMRRFYSTENATKVWKAHGYVFVFDRAEPIGGSVPGTFTTEFEGEQNALSDLTSNPTTSVREISQVEWEQLTKKKWVHPISNISKPLKETSPQVPLLPTPSQSPAVLVAEPTNRPTDILAASAAAPIKNIDDVLKTDTVVPAQPQAQPAKAKSARPRKVT